MPAAVQDYSDLRLEPASAAPKPQRGRWLGWVQQAPPTLRALVRGDEIWLVVLAALVGGMAGLSVLAIDGTAQRVHQWAFALAPGQRLSGTIAVDQLRVLVVPALGGLLLGLTGLALGRWWPRRAIDPIEANALYGGQMSLNDSLILVGQTLLSNGAGASIGLEAGYTQIGAAFGSRLGRLFKVRRGDLRLLVGCGTAGAIAAAFGAPLTGAFYGFELVIGTYSVMTLAPVMAAAIVATAVNEAFASESPDLFLQIPTRIEPVDYVAILALGAVCALLGIAIMRGVTLTEAGFRRSGVPVWLRPAVGGVVVGLLALWSPQVLSSGHAALAVGIDAPYPLQHVALLITFKAVASAVSIGSGFRGGLFFASLFLGAMAGKLFAGLMAMITTVHALPPVVCALIGMSGLTVAVVGGPLTMGFLALETTGSLPLTVAVLVACVVSSLTVRRAFGYSFATWRFHLRGESIRSAVDIGWVRNLTVGRMMRREQRTVRSDLSLASFRRDYPLGSTERVIAVEPNGRYAGIIQLAEAHAAEHEPTTLISALLHARHTSLLPQMTIKEAVAAFEHAETDALAVVDTADTARVIGLLTEQHALRRYSAELDRRQRELSGE